MADNDGTDITDAAPVVRKILGPEGELVVQAVAKQAAHHSVVETLTALGFDMNNPVAVQRDMAAIRDFREMVTDEEYRKDMAHLREWRVAMGNIKSRGVMWSFGMALIGLATLIMVALKSKFGLF